MKFWTIDFGKLKPILKEPLKKDNQLRIILFVFSTSFSVFLTANHMNLLAVGFMFIMIWLFFTKYFQLQKFDAVYVILLLLMALVSMGKPSFKLSSFVFTGMFFVCFIYIRNLIQSNALSPVEFRKVIRLLVKLYFIVLVIQQICVVVGLPIFNFTFGDIHAGSLKLNSLATEASAAGSQVALLCYFYIILTEVIQGRSFKLSDYKQDRKLWYMALYTLLTLGSTTALLFLVLLLIRITSIKSIFWMIPLFIIGSFAASYLSPKAFNRSIAFTNAFLTGDADVVNEVDHSAAYRVVPLMSYHKQVDLFSDKFWLGEGRGASRKYFPQLIDAITEKMDSDYGGHYPTFIITYGFLSFFLLMCIYFRECITKIWSIDFFLFIQVIVLSGWNQMGWLTGVMLFMAIKYYKRFYKTI